MSIYQTQPPLENSSIHQKTPKLNLLTFNKQRSFPSILHFPKVKHQSSIKNSRLFTQNYEYLGHPQSQYLIQKIKNYTNHIPQIRQKYKRLKTMNKLSRVYSLTQPTQQNSRLKFSRNPQNQTSTQQAILINESQKIERLMTKRQQQQQQYKCLSQRIHLKLQPKKVKVPFTEILPSMQKLTWYKNWNKINNNQKSRTKAKMIQRYKSAEADRKNIIRKNNLTSSMKKQRSREDIILI